MEPKRNWRWLLAAGALLVSAAAACGLFGPRTGTNLTRDQYEGLYGECVIPPTATDVSVYVQSSWRDENAVISFAVPDEQAFVAWATPLIAEPQPGERKTVVSFDGGRLQLIKLGQCLEALRVDPADKTVCCAIYDPSTRRVYFQKTHRAWFKN